MSVSPAGSSPAPVRTPATSSSASTSASAGLNIGEAVVDGVTKLFSSDKVDSSGKKSDDSGDAIKKMTEAFIFSNMKKMMEESGKALEEAMKKGSGG
jgi:hypothetical protein